MATDTLGNIFDELEEAAAGLVDDVVELVLGPARDLVRVSLEREIELPRDTYAHDDVQTEWWYYTGHLFCDNRPFGFELVFFKRCTEMDRLGRIIPMRVLSPVNYYAHFAVTDIEAKQFRYSHRRSINGSNPAGASFHCHNIWLGDWSARELNGQHIISARMNNTELALSLKPTKPIVKHGINGVSFKDVGEGSYYLAYTRMEAAGELVIGDQRYPVNGTAWMDHEFGTWTMKEKIQGWDWFALQLDNGYELVAFYIRGQNGQATRFSEATLIDREGRPHRFSHDQFTVTPTGEWQSYVTKTTYPSGWRLQIPSINAEFEISPVLRAQELDTRGSTMIIYWEGANTVKGHIQGSETAGRAYVELVGYDRSHEDLTLWDYFISEIRYRGLGLA